MILPNGSSQKAISYPFSGTISQTLLRCFPPVSEIFLHNPSISGSVMQIWIKPDFQYSKLSVRLSAFGSIYSKISKPLDWLNLTRPLAFSSKLDREYLLLPYLLEYHQLNSTGSFITVNPNTSLYHFTAWFRSGTLNATWFNTLGYIPWNDDDDGFASNMVSHEYLVVSVVTIISIICHAEADLERNRKFKKRHARHHNILSGVVSVSLPSIS
jgi:hypothetical protein